MIGFLARLLWGTATFTVKHVVVPIAISAATAVVLSELTQKVRGKDDAEANGAIDPELKPAP